ncbi:MAG: anti-sigma factor [Novosphingobium sp.]|nr:anti-sigma factor [Novosphingobium sp.]
MAEVPLSAEERDGLVAELALGVLDGEERAAALRALMADPAFTPGLIEDWQRRLAPLYDEYTLVAPADTLWAGIAARIDDADAPREGALRQLRIWRAGAMIAGVAAASLALVLLFRPVPSSAPLPEPAAPVAIAQMTGAADGPVVLARFDPASGRLSLRASAVKPGALAPELWVIPPDGKPRSLGLIAANTDSQLPVEARLRAFMTEGATLAVTMEPVDGAPHAAPSSAPVASGKISLI